MTCISLKNSGSSRNGLGGLSSQNCRLAPLTVKHTGQESGGELRKIFKV